MWKKLPDPVPFLRAKDDSTIHQPRMSFAREYEGWTEYLHAVQPLGIDGLVLYLSNRRDVSAKAAFIRYEAEYIWPAEVLVAVAALFPAPTQAQAADGDGLVIFAVPKSKFTTTKPPVGKPVKVGPNDFKFPGVDVKVKGTVSTSTKPPVAATKKPHKKGK